MFKSSSRFFRNSGIRSTSRFDNLPNHKKYNKSSLTRVGLPRLLKVSRIIGPLERRDDSTVWATAEVEWYKGPVYGRLLNTSAPLRMVRSSIKGIQSGKSGLNRQSNREKPSNSKLIRAPHNSSDSSPKQQI